MIRVLAALTMILAAFAVACDSGDSDDAAPTGEATPLADAPASCTPTRPHAAGTTTETLPSGGLDRKYLLHVPPGYDGATAMPLALALPGYAQPAESLVAVSGLEAIADSKGYIVAFPEGTGEPLTWNAYSNPNGAADTAFLTELLDELEGSLCIDEDRVYATGYSAGGGMTLRLTCDLENRFAAVAVVSATWIACQANVPMLAFHGTTDVIVPFEGGPTSVNPALVFPPVRRGVSEWAGAAGCDTLPIISRPNSEIEVSTFKRCLGGDGDVMLYTVINGGHTWPGGLPLPESVVGRTTDQIDASTLMLEFFDAHPPREGADPAPGSTAAPAGEPD